MWKSINLITALFLLASCGKEPRLADDTDWGGRETTVSIAYLKEKYLGAPLLLDGDIYIEGRIVSSDRRGNMRNTIYIQDDTGAICKWAAVSDYYKEYQTGMAIKVNCNSLVLTDYGKMVRLAMYTAADYYEVTPLSLDKLRAVSSINMGDWSMPEPARINIPTIKPTHCGCRVSFGNVQFIENELGLAWCDDGIDTDRTIEDASGNRHIVRTSRNADFAHYALPSGRGYIEGILTQFNGTSQLIVINPDNVIMGNPSL